MTEAASHTSGTKEIFFVGTPDLLAPHLRALEGVLNIRPVAPDKLRDELSTGDFCIFVNEHSPPYREAIRYAQELNCPTLLAIDGIIEWRSSWENHYPPKVWKPVLCHKVCCIGLSQAQILSSWGNGDKIEVVGLPRLDALHGRKPRDRKPGEPFRILVMTAKNPGFTHQQIQTTQRSLQELKQWFEAHTSIESTHHESTPTQSTHGESTPTQSTHGESTPIEVVWRLTQDMAQRIGVENALKDTTGTDLAAALETADAVITTPSTSMLEAMIQGLPTALLDFHNTPQMAPACWHLSSTQHFDTLIPELIKPPTEKLLHQKFLLKQHLQTDTAATPRFARLVNEMRRIAAEKIEAGEEIHFSPNLLDAPIQTASQIAEEYSDSGWREIAMDQRFLLGRQARQIDVLEDQLQAARLKLIDAERRLSTFTNHPVLGLLLDIRGRLFHRNQK